MDVGVVAAIALCMLLLGFLLGTRGRQLLQALSRLPTAARSLTVRIPTATISISAPTVAPPAGVPTAGASGAETAVEEPHLDRTADLLDSFFSLASTGLDEHTELQVNPVLLYQLKQEKLQQRKLKKLEALRLSLGESAEGLSEAELAEKLAQQELAGGHLDAADPKPNAINILIGAGARFTSTRNDSSEAIALNERRRLVRNVDAYLARTFQIPTRKDAKATQKRASADKGRLRSAFEVAKETEYLPHAVHSALVRAERCTRNVQQAREVLRAWEARRRQQRVRDGLPELEALSDSDGEDGARVEGHTSAAELRRGGPRTLRRMPTAGDIATLQAEFLDEGGANEDDEDYEALAA